MKKLMLLIAGGIGYVLGTKAGRERYDQIRGAARKVKDNPTVQEKAHQAADVAREKAPVMTEKVKGAASAAAEKVKPSGSAPVDQLNPDSTARQDNPYPQGDLP
ncbi:hypothetical protein [Nocardioides sp. InS609-2]|uniref:hypothetical protein n=1 Tax=Nocardioides sp. InS609-2 TaxID=2760705 RepID=UPI0017B555E7|nr:hypothetical protein [Nocardioides sp. InS609-2]MBA3783646.1 YtxH domain-containing protein [Nocardioides sp.]